MAEDAEKIDHTYFYPAASLYIQGNITSASNLVVKGLSIAPKHTKLLRLKDLLKQQNKKQKDQKQNKENQKKDKKKQDKDKKKQDKQKQKNQKKDQPKPAPQPEQKKMSKDEAKQLLDEMKQDEKQKRLQLHPVRGAPVKVDKDW